MYQIVLFPMMNNSILYEISVTGNEIERKVNGYHVASVCRIM